MRSLLWALSRRQFKNSLPGKSFKESPEEEEINIPGDGKGQGQTPHVPMEIKGEKRGQAQINRNGDYGNNNGNFSIMERIERSR